MDRTKLLFILLAVFVVFGALAAFLYGSSLFSAGTAYTPPVASPTNATPTQKTHLDQAASVDLGTEIYQKSNNPVADKLPDSVAPVPNPAADAYKNPFE